MKNLKFIVVATLLLLTACSSAPVKQDREITLMTNVQEAQVFLDGKSLGVIFAGYRTISVPINGIHLIRLQRFNDISDFTVTPNFDNSPVQLNFNNSKTSSKSNNDISPK